MSLQENQSSAVGLLTARLERVKVDNKGKERKSQDWLLAAGEVIHQAFEEFNFIIYRNTLLTNKDLKDEILVKNVVLGKQTFEVHVFREGTIQSNQSLENQKTCYYGGPNPPVLTQDTKPTVFGKLFKDEHPLWTLRFTNRQEFDVKEVSEAAFQLLTQKTKHLEIVERVKRLPTPISEIITKIEGQATKQPADKDKVKEVANDKALPVHDGTAGKE